MSTPEELALLTKIYIGTAHEKEAIDLLLSENLGLTSKIAEHDPQMVFSLLIDALDSSKDNDFVLDVCQKILATDEARSRKYAEDDRVWRTLGRTARVNNDRYDVFLPRDLLSDTCTDYWDHAWILLTQYCRDSRTVERYI